VLGAICFGSSTTVYPDTLQAYVSEDDTRTFRPKGGFVLLSLRDLPPDSFLFPPSNARLQILVPTTLSVGRGPCTKCRIGPSRSQDVIDNPQSRISPAYLYAFDLTNYLQVRLENDPTMMRRRRQTVEHPFGTCYEDAALIVRQAIESFGGLHVVVNNAGICRDRMFASLTEADWDAVVAVHLKGHFCIASHAARYWREQAKDSVIARIFNTSSGAGMWL
jgi:hypothetical protein